MNVSEKFALAQRIIVGYYPLLSSFYSMCNIKESSEHITIRLNTKISAIPTLEYNINFLNIISEKTLATLISIELFRLLLHHQTTRLIHPINICYKASNIICTDKRIMRFCIEDARIKACFPTINTVLEINKNFDVNNDFTLEKIFTTLVETDGKNDKDSKNNITNSNVDFPTGTTEADALQKHFSDAYIDKNTEAWGENELINRKITRQIQKETSKKDSWGDLPANIAELIKVANTINYDPRAILNKFVVSIFSEYVEFTRMKPSRRFGQDLIGIIPGQRHKLKSKVLIALDTSGSMPDDILMEGINLMQSTLKYAEVYFCCWDCICSEITKECTIKKEYNLIGRGGTNPQCIIDKVRAEKLLFNGIIIISDCIFNWNNPGGKEKICIVSTKKEPPDWCKWTFKLEDLLKYHR